VEDVSAMVFLFYTLAKTREVLEEAHGEKEDDDDSA
jgi:hypothetical protein